MRQRKQINEEIIREVIAANEEEIELLGNNAEPLVDDSHEIEAAMREFEARQEYNDGVSAVCDID